MKNTPKIQNSVDSYSVCVCVCVCVCWGCALTRAGGVWHVQGWRNYLKN